MVIDVITNMKRQKRGDNTPEDRSWNVVFLTHLCDDDVVHRNTTTITRLHRKVTKS